MYIQNDLSAVEIKAELLSHGVRLMLAICMYTAATNCRSVPCFLFRKIAVIPCVESA
jgi:hypothetical protein